MKDKEKTKNGNISLYIVFILLFFLNLTCSNPTSPPPPSQEKPKAIQLKLIEVSCTEAFINITASDTVLPVNITLNKDEKALFNFTLTKTDTLIIDTTLQPGKTYVYQTSIVVNKEKQNSDTLQVKTIDTTSHDFIWQTFNFGDPNAGSSELNDIAIVNENNIYAGGEIYMKDSLGNADTQIYCMVKWNGNDWELQKLSYDFNSVIVSIRGLYIPNSNDFYLAAGSVFHWDGISDNSQLILSRLNLSNSRATIEKIWGDSNSGIYGVGNAGTIIHYKNNSWQQIESGTTSNLGEIWGANEPVSGKLKILTTVSAINDNKILSLTATSANDTLNWPKNINISGIWLNGRNTYAGGADIWKNENNIWHQETTTGYFFTRVRGTKCNNIFGIGPDGIVHYNGSSWKVIMERPEGIVIKSGDCYNNMIALVGLTSSGGVVGKAVVMIGTQIK